jgi:hypothetical protein
MKNVRFLAVIVLALSLVSPSAAHAAGIPLSHCETLTGNLPPANHATNWAANGVCNDVIYVVGGRTLFIQENQSPENPKDHSSILTYEIFLQDSSLNWIDLGKGVRPIQGLSASTIFTNFVETPQGIFLGGIYSQKNIGTCGTAACKTIDEYATLKIDGSNHLTKFTLPAIAGSNKVPGTPFASGLENLVYFAQNQGIITTFGKKGVATASGKIVKKGTAVIFYSLDLAISKVTPMPQLTSMANESGVPPLATFGKSVLLSNPESGKIMQFFPSGKFFDLTWETDALYEPIKDGLVSTVANQDIVTFHLTSGENRTCNYSGATTGLPANTKDITFEPDFIKGSTSTNTVLVPFHLGTTSQQNFLRINSDCSSSINDLGSDNSATQKFIDEITHQESAQARKGEVLRMFTPDGFVFDKVLAASYEANGVTMAGFSGPRVLCTLDQSKVAKMVSQNFAGNNYVEWKVNPGSLGANCSYPGPQKFKIVDEAFSISVHYVPNKEVAVPTPTPTVSPKNVVLQAAGIGDPKWPAKCPAVTDTVGGVQPKISGFKFDGAGGENFKRLIDGGSTNVTAPGNVLGCYADIASLNGSKGNAWQIGTINRDSSGFYWLNAAGVRWGLTLSGTILITDKNNPYYDKGHQFITY